MRKRLSKQGFTLVEVLTAIVILGILMGVSIVAISYILNRSKTSFYSNLEKQLVLAAQSYYTDHRTLLPQSIGQQRQVPVETLIKNNYLKRGQVVDYGKAECDTTTSYIKTVKTTKEDYIHTIYLQCPAYSVNDEKQIRNINVSVSIPKVGNAKKAQANISMSVDSELDRIASYQYTIYKNDQIVYTSTNISGDNQTNIQKTIALKKYVPGAIKVVVTVYDIYGNIESAFATASLYDNGLPECGTPSPKLSIKNNNDWINENSKDTTRKISIGCVDGTTLCLNKNFSRTFTTDTTTSYVTILGENNAEVNCPVSVMIDKTKPICASINDSTVWTNVTRTITVTCNDATSGCVKANYSETYDGKSVTKTQNITIKDKAGNTNTCKVNVYVDKEKPTCKVTGGSKTWTKNNRSVTVTCDDKGGSGCKVASYVDTISSTVKTKTYTVEDNAGNKGTCTADIYVDKTAPTTPTNGTIGAVSGSNAKASIKTAASGSKDDHSGFSHYLYLITNSSTKPDKNDTRFSTSLAFTRSCGTSYYAWAVAVDKVGNRSAVKSLGNTSDGANQYSKWTSCTKKCGGGTQTRTNSCALVTGGKKQDCNVMACCSSTTTKWNTSWSSCSKKCGGGTQTLTGKKYSAYDSSISCGNDSKTQSCNTASCCSSTTPKYGNWSSCNVSCGTGTQTRTVTYQGIDGSTCKTDTESRTCDTGKPCKPATPTIDNPTGGAWVNYDFSLTVKTTTASSVIGYWQYSYDNSSWVTYKNSAKNQFVTTPFSAERHQLAYIRVCTKEGVCSDSANTMISIDKTKPYWKVTMVKGGYRYQSGIYQNFTCHARIAYYDDASGLEGIYNLVGNAGTVMRAYGNLWGGKTTAGSDTDIMGSFGANYAYYGFTLCDVAKNCATQSRVAGYC